jgi:hypothetical protein
VVIWNLLSIKELQAECGVKEDHDKKQQRNINHAGNCKLLSMTLLVFKLAWHLLVTSTLRIARRQDFLLDMPKSGLKGLEKRHM